MITIDEAYRKRLRDMASRAYMFLDDTNRARIAQTLDDMDENGGLSEVALMELTQNVYLLSEAREEAIHTMNDPASCASPIEADNSEHAREQQRLRAQSLTLKQMLCVLNYLQNRHESLQQTAALRHTNHRR